MLSKNLKSSRLRSGSSGPSKNRKSGMGKAGLGKIYSNSEEKDKN
jgi:hypothetical protein